MEKVLKEPDLSIATSPEPQYGMHISAIRKFITDHPEVKEKQLNASEINKAVIKPESKEAKSPYINLYAGKRDPDGNELVAPATIFVSHAWRYVFYDVVVDAMEQHAKKHPNAYFWFDLFTNNQNEVANKDFEWFSTTFRDGVVDIGQVLLVLSPWNDPQPVRRAWCLFEIFNALEEPDVKLFISLPCSEIDEMRSAVIANSECLINALTDIQAEKAEAKVDADRKLIFDVIAKSDGGFAHVNRQVKKGLRDWYVERLLDLTDETPVDPNILLNTAKIIHKFGYVDKALECAKKGLRFQNIIQKYDADLTNTIAMIHYEKGEKDQAMEYYLKALSLNPNESGENDGNLAAAYNNMAIIHNEKGEEEQAMDCYNKALSIWINLYGEDHPNVASAYGNLAIMHADGGRLKQAIIYFNKSVQIEIKHLGERHPSLGITYSNLGEVYNRNGDAEKALEYFSKALAIQLPTIGENNSTVAAIYMNMALVYSANGRKIEAVEYHRKSLEIREKIFSGGHPDMAESYYNVGCEYHTQGELHKALDNWNMAITHYLNICGENSIDVADTFENMALASESLKQYDKALQYELKVLTIRKNILGEEHAKVKRAQKIMERLQKSTKSAVCLCM